MMNSIKIWARKHKKGIIITCSLAAVVGTAVILIINGKRVIVPVDEFSEDVIAEAPKASQIPPMTETPAAIENAIVTTFPRSMHIRKLSAGQHASPVKLAQATERDIDLKPGQTFVNETIVRRRRAA